MPIKVRGYFTVMSKMGNHGFVRNSVSCAQIYSIYNIVNVMQWFVVHLVGITQRESHSLLRKLGHNVATHCDVFVVL